MYLRLDPDLEGFIEKYINSFIKWDIVVFFYNNIESTPSVSEIASLLGRKESDTRTALDELEKGNLIEREGEGKQTVYHYHPDENNRRLVSLFVSSLDVRDKRLLILAKLMRLEVNR